VKTFLTRTLPLLLCIAAGTVVSWVSIYAFWFAVWTFHSVPAARFCDAVGSFLLQPTHWIYELIGGDQSTIFVDPQSFSETNGVILGIVLYCLFRFVWNRREARKAAAPAPLVKEQSLEAKV